MQLSKGGMEERNLDSCAAGPSRARQRLDLETFVQSRNRCSAPSNLVGPQEDASALRLSRFRENRVTLLALRSVFSISHLSRGRADPLGVTRRYWPIYEAAKSLATALSRCNLRLQGFSGRSSLPSTASRAGHLLHGGALLRDHRHAEPADEPGFRGRFDVFSRS